MKFRSPCCHAWPHLDTAASLLNSPPAEVPFQGGSISFTVTVGHRGDRGLPGDQCLQWPQDDGAVCVLKHLEFSSWSVTYELCKLWGNHCTSPSLLSETFHPCLGFPTWKTRMSALSGGLSVTKCPQVLKVPVSTWPGSNSE